MDLVEFFTRAKQHVRDDEKPLGVSVYDYSEMEGGGWRVDCVGISAYGDTINEALRAAYHAFMGKPSERARLNAPDKFNGKVIFPARRIKYDYRSRDYRNRVIKPSR